MRWADARRRRKARSRAKWARFDRKQLPVNISQHRYAERFVPVHLKTPYFHSIRSSSESEAELAGMSEAEIRASVVAKGVKPSIDRTRLHPFKYVDCRPDGLLASVVQNN